MKRGNTAVIRFIFGAIILGLAAIWVMTTSQPFNALAYTLLGIMIFAAFISFYRGINDLRNQRAGLSSDDELSRRIREKAAAKTFTVSIYMWLFSLLFAVDWIPIESVKEFKFFIAFGMMAMVLIFLFIWLYLSKVGIDDENQD
ncbi:hypothetical protein [Roseivirga sp.]|uniref:hypothetical protein n=1 Tax=Roseivirga sp. TaxID=1964215 RepID=UPI003B523D12